MGFYKHRAGTVTYAPIVWHKHYIPRYSFILWLAMHKRLPTSELLRAHSNHIHSYCPLCNSALETLEHLFFSCSYSSVVITAVMAVGNWSNVPVDLENLIGFIEQFQGRKMHLEILKLILATPLYKIWGSRNSKIHEGTLIPPHELTKDITNLIKA